MRIARVLAALVDVSEPHMQSIYESGFPTSFVDLTRQEQGSFLHCWTHSSDADLIKVLLIPALCSLWSLLVFAWHQIGVPSHPHAQTLFSRICSIYWTCSLSSCHENRMLQAFNILKNVTIISMIFHPDLQPLIFNAMKYPGPPPREERPPTPARSDLFCFYSCQRRLLSCSPVRQICVSQLNSQGHLCKSSLGALQWVECQHPTGA